ncbi:flagella basal body P-ring formation protein FlgA [Methylomarinovum tepidoasis]|uniref:Flagella basal body P-ring formation protein FlgA n=1 Tax=Methylomarinovum tepidoasis TaxID=2840183 RepID=A0AAU9CUC7_9GAMM|nr:flagellar basal body P-ring formation chaperone FlgA [Methylomarinovum sp. IN45]BCX87689.1 flagella basal body P-ring formation protein FlgA [Methylomarinovum sp. IN45]
MRRVLLGLLLSLPLTTVSVAAERQSLAAVRQAIAVQLTPIIRQQWQDFDVHVPPLDPRLHLPACSAPLRIEPLRGEVKPGSLSVRVRCPGDRQWSIYAKAVVRVYQPVITLRQGLPKGTRLTAAAVMLQRQELGKLRQGYFTDPSRVIGLRLRRSLPAGAVLQPQVLVADKLVHRGQAVHIRANLGTLEVSMEGHALMDGARGERIRVRNDRSRQVVEGVVQGPGEVQVQL